MYRVVVILGGSLVLAACSSSSNWLDSLKPAPPTESVGFESEPAGAEAKTSTGQACKTPCRLDVPANAPFSVTFSLDGYVPAIEQVELVGQGDGSVQMRPNPVLVELTKAPPPPPVKKKPVRRAPTAAKPRPAAQPAATPAPAPATPAQATSPWPSAPPPQAIR